MSLLHRVRPQACVVSLLLPVSLVQRAGGCQLRRSFPDVVGGARNQPGVAGKKCVGLSLQHSRLMQGVIKV